MGSHSQSFHIGAICGLGLEEADGITGLVLEPCSARTLQ
jgi:hypothetical protein